MSSDSEKPSRGFVPVEDAAEVDRLLKAGAKVFASTMVWTKNRGFSLNGQLCLYTGLGQRVCVKVPASFNFKEFRNNLDKSDTRDCLFSISLQSAMLFFKAAFIQHDTVGLVFHSPEQVFKVQRRKELRLKVPEEQNLKVEFEDPEFPDKMRVKRLYDLSAGGLSFLTGPEDASIFVKGMILKNVTFSIGNRKIMAAAEVRHSFESQKHGKARIKVGLFFKNIRPGQAQQIATYVFDESRKYILKYL